MRQKSKKIVIGVGFEPTPPERPVPETGALDRSAIQPPDPRDGTIALAFGRSGPQYKLRLNRHSSGSSVGRAWV